MSYSKKVTIRFDGHSYLATKTTSFWGVVMLELREELIGGVNIRSARGWAADEATARLYLREALLMAVANGRDYDSYPQSAAVVRSGGHARVRKPI